MHKWLALPERYGFPPLPLPLRLSMSSCWVLEAQTSWSFIWKKQIYYYLMQDTYLGNFPVNKEKLGSGEVKISSFLIWLRVGFLTSKAPILVKLSWLSRILQVFQNVTSLTTVSGIWDTNPLVITEAPPRWSDMASSLYINDVHFMSHTLLNTPRNLIMVKEHVIIRLP